MKHEQAAISELNREAIEVYEEMMVQRLKFDADEVSEAPKSVALQQIEVCWNQPRPFDVFHYMMDKINYFEEIGLKHISFHSDTPLMVTDYPSDIYPKIVRIAHKIYMKTKMNLRNELILGNELKTDVPFLNGTLSDLFFADSDVAKKFTYSKFVLQVLRRTVGLEEEKYRHADLNFVQMKRGGHEWKRSYLQGLLDRAGVPAEFSDVDFFDVFSDILDSRGSVHRKNFSHLTAKQYRRVVSESRDFVRAGHGKYRLRENMALFKANLEYRAIRNKLDEIHPEENPLRKIYHSDAGIAGLSNIQTSNQ